MYLTLYGLHALPFRLSPDARFVFESATHAAASEALVAVCRPAHGVAVMTGEAGTGKTTLLERLLQDAGNAARYVRLNQSPGSAIGLLQSILLQLGESPFQLSDDALRTAVPRAIAEQTSAGRPLWIIIDDAQEFGVEIWEEFDHLLKACETAEPGVGVVVSGRPELDERLASPTLATWSARIVARANLEPLTQSELHGYIAHRLRVAGNAGRALFDDSALELLYRYTGGVPRLINTLADTSMTVAHDGHRDVISSTDIRTAVASLQWVEYSRRRPQRSGSLPTALAPLVPPEDTTPATATVASAAADPRVAGTTSEAPTASDPSAVAEVTGTEAAMVAEITADSHESRADDASTAAAPTLGSSTDTDADLGHEPGTQTPADSAERTPVIADEPTPEPPISELAAEPAASSHESTLERDAAIAADALATDETPAVAAPMPSGDEDILAPAAETIAHDTRSVDAPHTDEAAAAMPPIAAALVPIPRAAIEDTVTTVVVDEAALDPQPSCTGETEHAVSMLDSTENTVADDGMPWATDDVRIHASQDEDPVARAVSSDTATNPLVDAEAPHLGAAEVVSRPPTPHLFDEVIVLEASYPLEEVPTGDSDWLMLDTRADDNGDDAEPAGCDDTRRTALHDDAQPVADPVLDALVAAHFASLPRASELPRIESDEAPESLDVLLDSIEFTPLDRDDAFMIDVGTAARPPSAASADSRLDAPLATRSTPSGDSTFFDAMVLAHLGALSEHDRDVFDIDPEPSSEAMDALDNLVAAHHALLARAGSATGDTTPQSTPSTGTQAPDPAEPIARLVTEARQLLVRAEGRTVRSYALTDGQTLIIGRTPDNDIVLDSPFVSRHHARLTVMGDLLRIEDLDSRNGVSVLDERVREAVLECGDAATIGHHELRLDRA